MSPGQGHALIVADIEGRTGCWHDKDAAFMTMEWIRTGTAMAPWMKRGLMRFCPASTSRADWVWSGYDLGSGG